MTLLSKKEIQLPGWGFLFIACIVSRLLTAIRYIEDPDSLRFALAAVDYDVAAMQPHFPAYPVYCFVVKIFYFLFGNFSTAFAFVGGLATFACIFFTVQLAALLWKETPQPLLAILLFLNPLIWLMGNRFMPDLSGLALAMGGLYFFVTWALQQSAVRERQPTLQQSPLRETPQRRVGWSLSLRSLLKGTLQQRRPIFLLAFAVGLLAGVRLSYLPLLLIPCLIILFSLRIKHKVIFLAVLLASVLLWLIPLIIDTGLQPLIEIAQTQTSGHFEDFGGTISTESDIRERALTFLRHGWADGLGGFWPGRHWATLIFSFCLVLFFGLGASKLKPQGERRLYWFLLISFIVYAGWILFYQNIIFKSRHHLPLIPILLVVLSLGYAHCREYWGKIAFAGISVLLAANIWITGKLVLQHRSPTAIAQLKNYLESNNFEGQILITSDLVKYYLQKQKVRASFIDINDNNEVINQWLEEGKPVFIIANLDIYHNFQLVQKQVFYHNPYVNRMWPVVVLSVIQPKTK